MVGWYYQLNRDEFEQTLGDEGQGSLACSVHVITNSWTQLSNRTTIYLSIYICTCIYIYIYIGKMTFVFLF